MITFKIKQGLENLPDARFIREEVFMKEQGFEDEFDDIDAYAYHIVVYVNDSPAACGRIFPDTKDKDTYIFGRIATLPTFRKQHLASKVMLELEKKAVELNAKKAKLSAQVTAQPFYEKLNYQVIGEMYYDEHCPHITMVKEL